MSSTAEQTDTLPDTIHDLTPTIYLTGAMLDHAATVIALTGAAGQCIAVGSRGQCPRDGRPMCVLCAVATARKSYDLHRPPGCSDADMSEAMTAAWTLADLAGAIHASLPGWLVVDTLRAVARACYRVALPPAVAVLAPLRAVAATAP